jgi:copper homeostasis protein
LTVVEAAVETLDAALAAERAGVDQIELCVNLDEGGATPSPALVSAATHRLHIPVFVLIRPRTGDFVYSKDEMQVIVRDIESARGLGAAGVVLGVLTPDHCVDVEQTRALVDAAAGLPLTFHRAFDLTPSPVDALEQLIGIGVTRILTSGSAATALEGVDVIAGLVEQAGERIAIIAGGGIRHHNVREIIARTGVRDVHARFMDEAGMRRLVDLAQDPRSARRAAAPRSAAPTPE